MKKKKTDFHLTHVNQYRPRVPCDVTWKEPTLAIPPPRALCTQADGAAWADVWDKERKRCVDSPHGGRRSGGRPRAVRAASSRPQVFLCRPAARRGNPENTTGGRCHARHRRLTYVGGSSPRRTLLTRPPPWFYSPSVPALFTRSRLRGGVWRQTAARRSSPAPVSPGGAGHSVLAENSVQNAEHHQVITEICLPSGQVEARRATILMTCLMLPLFTM